MLVVVFIVYLMFLMLFRLYRIRFLRDRGLFRRCDIYDNRPMDLLSYFYGHSLELKSLCSAENFHRISKNAKWPQLIRSLKTN